jgi:hypothetical protein
MGGGMVFQFDPAQIAGDMGAPQLLPGNRGWTWGKADQGRRIEMRFDPPLAKVYFERGNPSELRAFFFKDPIERRSPAAQGVLQRDRRHRLGPTPTERFGWPTLPAGPMTNWTGASHRWTCRSSTRGKTRRASVASSRRSATS